MKVKSEILSRAIIVIALMCSSLAGYTQDSLLAKFKRYRNTAYQEKVYLHTDRQFYVTGETLWFKAFLVDATFHKPGHTSKVLYVDVIDKDKASVLQQKISLTDGKGSGAIFIPASLGSGSYLLRAYTSWMKNFSDTFFFQKRITIVNSFVQLDPVSTTPANDFEAEFFPEGGNLVNNVNSIIGFKVVDKYGKGLDARGAVVNNLNDTIARFNTLRFGMGSFQLAPTSEFSYRAVVYVRGLTPKIIPFADAFSTGFVMHVAEEDNSLNITVSAPQGTQSAHAVIDLFVHTRHQVIEIKKAQLQDGTVALQIPLSKIPGGITHLTVFEGSKALCERLFFRQPSSVLELTAQTGLATYQTRSKVNLQVKVTTKASTDLSLAIHRIDSLGTDRSVAHIPEYLLLSSDLPGYIESPAFYFSKDPDAKAAADNLMLTQGWRRFKWESAMEKQKSMTFIPENSGHLIRGKVKDLSGNLAQGVLTYLTTPGKITELYGSRSATSGEVMFEMQNFTGSRRVITYVDSLHRLELLNPFREPTLPTVLPLLQLPASTEQHLLERSVGMQVQNIYFEDRYTDPPTDSSAFFGRADETYYLDDYTRFPVMEEVMREYVPGVLVRKQKDGFRFILIDVVNKKPLYEGPMILLDGVPVFETDKIMAFDPLKIEKLEVVTRRFYHGLLTFPGIVSYTTYNGDLGGFQLDSRYTSVNYPGIQMEREFYSPKHEYVEGNENSLPDQRSLLYWNPEIIVGKDGKSTIEFFTSDLPGKYLITLEGLAADGTPGTYIGQFTVK